MYCVLNRNANRGTRFVNFYLDIFFLSLLVKGSIYLDLFGIRAILDMHFNLWFGVVSFIYYILFEGFTGKTVGKYITKTKVITWEGHAPSFGVIVGRTLGRFIPLDALSYFGEKGWHDKWSDTRVVYV